MTLPGDNTALATPAQSIPETLPGHAGIDAEPASQGGLASAVRSLPLTTLPRVLERAPTLHVDPRPTPRYVVEDALGRGGMGDVVLVRDRDIDRRVAMKRLRGDGPTHQTFLESRFADEVRALGRLEHPNIVPIYDVGRSDEQLYFTMKYVSGEPLSAVIGRMMAGDRATLEAWPLARRCDVFAAILEALRFAHDQGILHLDVKPDNVMIGPHGEVLLMDWGIASLQGATVGGSIAGTPSYMSAEQASGLPLDERADLFSAFAVFFELLTLRPYLRTDGPVEAILEEARTKTPPARLGPAWVHPHQHPVPMEYRHFLVRGLRRERDERIASVTVALERLRKIRSGEFDANCPITMTKRLQQGFARLVEGHQWIMPSLVFGIPVGALGYLLWVFLR